MLLRPAPHAPARGGCAADASTGHTAAAKFAPPAIVLIIPGGALAVLLRADCAKEIEKGLNRDAVIKSKRTAENFKDMKTSMINNRD